MWFNLVAEFLVEENHSRVNKVNKQSGKQSN